MLTESGTTARLEPSRYDGSSMSSMVMLVSGVINFQ